MSQVLGDSQIVDLLFKNSQTSFVLLDKNYNFIRVNEAYAQACGESVDFFPGKNHFELYPSNAIEIFETVKETKKPYTIYARPFVFPEDSERGTTYWDWKLEPVLGIDGEVDAFVWAIKEVTDRVKAEKDRERFINLSNNMVCKAGFDGYFVELSPAWEKILGHSEEVLKSKPFVEFVHSDDRENTVREAQRLGSEDGETIDFINRYECADGSYRWLSWNAVGDHGQNLIYAVAHDITSIVESKVELDRHRNELEKLVQARSEELAKSENRLSYLISNSPAVIYTCDVEGDFPATYISDNVEKVFGFKPGQFTSDPGFWANQIHPDDKQRVFNELANLFVNDTHTHEYRFGLPGGGYRWIHDELILQRDEKGEPKEIVGAWSDITKRREAEEELKKAIAEAEKANRSKSEFLSNMSHELRTPLNAVIGFSQLLSYADQAAEASEYAEEINAAGQHLLNLINDILELSKIESGKLPLSIENISLVQVISDCLKLIAPMAKMRHIKIVDEISGREDMILKADYTRIKQVLLNVLSNGIKYNIDHGQIEFSVSTVKKGMVHFVVSNTGPVIPAKMREKLFLPFERLGAENTSVEGTGIGLLVSKQLIKSMGGDIGYFVNDNGASSFWVEIPLGESSENSVHTKETHEKASNGFTGLKRVLYIEDNPRNMKLVCSILKRENHVPLSAYDGKSGLALAESERPDLILLDIGLPEMSGYEVLKRLQMSESTSGIPVAALTANATRADIERGQEAGFVAYITKPIDIKDFMQTVNQLLEEGEALLN